MCIHICVHIYIYIYIYIFENVEMSHNTCPNMFIYTDVYLKSQRIIKNQVSSHKTQQHTPAYISESFSFEKHFLKE